MLDQLKDIFRKTDDSTDQDTSHSMSSTTSSYPRNAKVSGTLKLKGNKNTFSTTSTISSGNISAESISVKPKPYSPDKDDMKINEEYIDGKVLHGWKIFDEIGGMNDERYNRIKDWIIKCLNCGEKWFLKSTLQSIRNFFIGKSKMKSMLCCPDCGNLMFSLISEDESVVVREVLLGGDHDVEGQD